MNKPISEIIKRWTRLATEAKQLGLTTIPIDPENMLMVLGVMPDSSADFSADYQNDYQAAIDILRKRAARELDGGFRAHHNALIYAANELENAQAFGREVGHES
ncbi:MULTISPECIES: hypothetical protein [Enterobacteriaceae]|uniref:Uncharacterized protein n=2 Tax=Enterobacteriaceae TaxID=543 RepID=A0AAP5XYP0_CITFR|nr:MULTISPECIES: hypothetical protein [Enterobacteriaceae]QZS46315.1 hypothetical protein K6966_17795 [Enterobacter cloacae complex sp.]HCJ6199850.1 hypothetical protein [Enterobacter hormaechei subsp. xiangfangensis]HEM8765760.1 hypothetical protein [Enterobacter roggenkampii]ELE6461902.1 hypothetical protein [Enterobacter hormaechei]ELP5721308.1 hypothetical protein [Enterobacter asburiae]